VTMLRFWNGDRGEVHLCQRYRKELGAEDEMSASRKSCRGFSNVRCL
jgi:hypothetical protein